MVFTTRKGKGVALNRGMQSWITEDFMRSFTEGGPGEEFMSIIFDCTNTKAHHHLSCVGGLMQMLTSPPVLCCWSYANAHITTCLVLVVLCKCSHHHLSCVVGLMQMLTSPPVLCCWSYANAHITTCLVLVVLCKCFSL